MVIFRENTEDVYAGMELEQGTDEAKRLIEFLPREYGWEIRPDSGIGLKPVSDHRLQAAGAGGHRVRRGQKGRTVGDAGAQGQHPEVHRGRLPGVGLRADPGRVRRRGRVGWDDCGGKPGDRILVKDTIADIFLQQVLTRPEDFDVIATTNLNGDYASDALAAQVGGIGIAPGREHQLRHRPRGLRGHPRHRAKYAGQDKVNPGSLLLSGVLMLEHLGWQEAADDIVRALEATIADRIVTYDFARLTEGATEVKTSEFAAAIIDRLPTGREGHRCRGRLLRVDARPADRRGRVRRRGRAHRRGGGQAAGSGPRPDAEPAHRRLPDPGDGHQRLRDAGRVATWPSSPRACPASRA